MPDIIDDVPIPEYFREETYRHLPGYMIYHDVNPNELHDCGMCTLRELGMVEKTRVGVCTCCGEWAEADRTDTGELMRLWNAEHNQIGNCPNCDTQVQYKQRGRLRTCATMNHTTRLLFVQVIEYNCVWLRGFVIDVTYDKDESQPHLHFIEQVRYELTPGRARCLKRNYSHFYGVSKKWNEIQSVVEPWPINYMGAFIWYSIAGETHLKDSFLKYFPFETLYGREYPLKNHMYNRTNRTPWGRIFSYASMFPSLEMVVKLECWEFIDDLIGLNLKNCNFINWKAKNISGFLRMPKVDAKKLIHGVDKNRLMLYKLLKSADKALLYEAFDVDALRELCGKYRDSPERVLKYLTKQRYKNNGIFVLRDYWENANFLGRNMSVELIRFPKNLTQAHDGFHSAAMRLREEQRASADAAKEPKYRETYKNYRHLYEWSDGDYIAMVPPLLRDIKQEGQEMHHCVGGYIDRHASGATIIIFIRKKMLPARSLYTVEISPEGNLRQVQGFHNEWANKPTPEAKDFIGRWLREVGRRLDEEKKKKARESA